MSVELLEANPKDVTEDIAEPTVAPPPEIVLRPPGGWQLINVRELWHFRDLLYFLIWRDVKVRYKQTVLGVAWAVLQPALMMVVFTIFFSRLAGLSSGDFPYSVFVYAGLLPWTFFAAAVANAGNSVVGSERLITKIYFPRLAVPFASVAAAGVDFVVALGLLILLMLGYGIVPGPNILLAAPICLALLLAAAGIGTLLAALNVAYRDFRYVIPFLVQVWMFATPTIYMDLSANNTVPLDGWARTLLTLNPLTDLIAAFRAAVLGGPIAWTGVATACVASVLMFLIGCFYFRRVEASFADVI